MPKGIFLILFLISILKAQHALTISEDTSTESRGILYFGFFFDEITASSMKQVTDRYFNATLSNLPEFASFLENVSSAANVTNPFEFYAKPLDPNTEKYDPFYHVTAKYCGRNQVACAAYEKKNGEFIDTKFAMNLVGYVLTPRTFGIRVDLTSDQKRLFDEDNAKSASKAVPDWLSLFQLPLPGEVEVVQQEIFPPPLPATSTRAHVTLGCAPGVSAVVTGPDLLEAIEFERNIQNDTIWHASWNNITDPMDPGSKMKVSLFKPTASSSSDEYVFIIYPRVKLVANATLARYYQKQSDAYSSSTRIYGNGSNNLMLISISFSIMLQIVMLSVGKCGLQ